MGLFGGGRKREKEELQQSWRGRLNAELWANAPLTYYEEAREIEVEWAETALARKLGEPLSREGAATAAKLMPITGAQGIAPLEDGVRAAYLVSFAETWEDLDAEKVRLLAREGCAVAAKDGMPDADTPRMLAGAAMLGFFGNHPERMQGFAAPFKPLYDVIAGWGSYQRLSAVGRDFASGAVETFGPYFMADDEDKPTAEHCYRLAWNLGLTIWIWEACGFARNNALEPSA